ncbi:hypothetical protein BX600DRAFT_297499 [Xylariales sp. PMI_506]|nr:hypothetical protein BX600DRAFT_297499 [Xylariales sp. PMI_506]
MSATETLHQIDSEFQPQGSANEMQANGTHDDTGGSSTSGTYSGPLVYAKPKDLPSFPSVGLGPGASAASAAATLGWSRQKSPEIWKPDSSASASAAAVLATDYKMATAWAPSPSNHGAQAAMLAHKSAKSTDIWKPSETDHGYSAATQAFKADRNPVAGNNTDSSVSTLNRQRSLMAARGAMKSRPRANTAPAPRESYPDKSNAAANALKAATKAHKPNRPTPSKDAGAVPYTTMNRQMFTSHPPINPEPEDQSREDVLHASALAMAKRMFNQQQKLIEQTKKAHANDPPVPRRARSSSSLSDEGQPMQFNTLQDAAYKLAQERLARLHQENLKNREYQDYYGHGKAQRRFTIIGKLRRRSSSDGVTLEDQKRSQQIRRQMSIFSSKLSEVDEKKREHDRQALLAAAQRNVQAQLKGMDDKISAETGMVPPTRATDWEEKAQFVAQSRSENRMSHHGQIDLGGGKYMTREDIDAIAAQRVQPVLDEINQQAEKEHIRQTELRLEAEARKEAREIDKAREKEIAEIAKKLKEQDKQEHKDRKAEERREAKARKDEEKVTKAEQKRIAKEERHRSAPARIVIRSGVLSAEEVMGDDRVELNDVGQPVRIPTSSQPAPQDEESNMTRDEAIDVQFTSHHQSKSEGASPTDKVSPTGRVKTWFKSRFRNSSKSEDDRPKRSFLGGHALTGLDSNNASSISVDNGSGSVRAVAMAGRQRTDLSEDLSSSQPPRLDDISPMSSSSDDEYFRDEAQVQTRAQLKAPAPLRDPAAKKSHSPLRDSRFHEII